MTHTPGPSACIALRLTRRAVLPAIGLLLAGCMGPRPPVPEPVAPPVAWRVEPGPTVAIEREWWQTYGDPALTALVAQALGQNDDIAIAVTRVRQADAQARIARAALFPTLDFTAGGTRARAINAFGKAGTANTGQLALDASYEVDLFGRIGDSVGAARNSLLASEAARDTTILSVSAAAARGYITLRALDAQLDVVRQTLTSRAEALRLARDRARAGYTSQLEYEQARAEYESTAQAVPQAELAVARQENALGVLVGNPDAGAIARGLPLQALQQPPVPAGLPSELLRRRPDIAQAEYTLAATDAGLSAARKAYLPRIPLTASAGLVYATGLANPVRIWTLGGSVLAPLFEGGRIVAGADAAAAQRDEAAYAYRRVALTAFREVNDNLAAVQKLGEQEARLREQRDALAAALRHATNRYRAGYSPYLEQLDAQRQLFSAELNLIQTHADRLNASVALYQAMGGGWQPAGGSGQ
ncbi:Efflux transport system, outer membrane factor (OMF) lipoprotein [Cupriavidus sp. U2]|uniref:efflux transporter outer membrane subunit n=1 Tax=Cupriavidus sp. U2 TaxID=2920269 RepID=UPI00129E30D6|nr:efflux transporter outer membrane subunit [Cupriavidus sp. U2]KAI3593740.1 Efflux transport system, outer membrane factor (OMF) lipoprotein [Cupriavidus sp. U2]